MNNQIIAIYCFCDDFLKSIGACQEQWCNEKMTDAEVITVMIIATRFFYGNIERARCMLKEYGYIKKMLSKSRLNRRIQKIPGDIGDKMLEFSHSYSTYRDNKGHMTLTIRPNFELNINQAKLVQKIIAYESASLSPNTSMCKKF